MFAQLKLLWSENKRYFLIASLLLIGGVCIGFLQADRFEAIAQSMLKQVKELADQIQSSGGSAAVTFWTIFFNNTITSITMMGLGLFFAILPVVGLLSNGILLGFIMQKIAAAGINPLLMFAVGILPHGIFELPAVIFAAAIGIRYGTLTVKSIGALFRTDRRSDLKKEWVSTLYQLPAAFACVIVLLFIAAIVESMVTPLLIHNTIGGQVKLFK